MRAIIAASVLAVTFFSGWIVQGWRMETKLSELRTEYATAQFQALEKAHAQTIRLQEKADTAARKSAARQSALANDISAARSELERLQDIARSASANSCPAAANPAAALADVFQQCSARLQELAAKADGHANDVRALIDAWPTTD